MVRTPGRAGPDRNTAWRCTPLSASCHGLPRSRGSCPPCGEAAPLRCGGAALVEDDSNSQQPDRSMKIEEIEHAACRRRYDCGIDRRLAQLADPRVREERRRAHLHGDMGDAAPFGYDRFRDLTSDCGDLRLDIGPIREISLVRH